MQAKEITKMQSTTSSQKFIQKMVFLRIAFMMHIESFQSFTSIPPVWKGLVKLGFNSPHNIYILAIGRCSKHKGGSRNNSEEVKYKGRDNKILKLLL